MPAQPKTLPTEPKEMPKLVALRDEGLCVRYKSFLYCFPRGKAPWYPFGHGRVYARQAPPLGDEWCPVCLCDPSSWRPVGPAKASALLSFLVDNGGPGSKWPWKHDPIVVQVAALSRWHAEQLRVPRYLYTMAQVTRARTVAYERLGEAKSIERACHSRLGAALSRLMAAKDELASAAGTTATNSSNAAPWCLVAGQVLP